MAGAILALIDPPERDLGGFHVRRVLPAPERRMVGPFIFFDAIGPARFVAGEGVDVRPHPHIGLGTVTYLFEGELLHRDSLGHVQCIEPGAVNWMTAGRGIVHSERTPPERRMGPSTLHGIQSWVALPEAAEESAPSFAHHPAGSLPEQRRGGAVMRLIAGEAFGMRAPVRTFSDLFYLHVTLEPGAVLPLPEGPAERGVFVAAGALRTDGQEIPAGRMAVLAPGGVEITATAPALVMLLGGAPLGPRHIWWNFVSSRRERIEQAKADWKAGRFTSVPGDDEFIPLPED